MGALVPIIATFELGFIALFVAFALSGDSLGIFRAMALLLAGPFVFLMIPAILLLRCRHDRAASLLALASVPASWLIWHLA